MSTEHDCWECGRPAPAGVCLGPHAEEGLRAAVAAGHVEWPWGLAMTVEDYQPVL